VGYELKLARRATDVGTRIGAAGRAAVLLLKVYPMLPSRPINWVTPRPIVERFTYRTSRGLAVGDLYRPSSPGPHPAVVVCLGVVPFGVEHPQVPRLGEALARSGFAALLYWSPAMRDFRLDPVDVADIASSYECLLARSDIEGTRSGLIGTCVGGAFALMASADARIRDRVAFVCAYAPYASMSTLCRDIASASRERDGVREAWAVDPLTRKVYVHSVTALLEQDEAALLQTACAEPDCLPVDRILSAEARTVQPLLGRLSADEVEDVLDNLPATLRQRLTAMSPVHYVGDVHAPLVVLLHDRDDVVIPVGESRRLRDAFGGRAGIHYTEFTVFKHLDPTKGKPPLGALTRELLRFFGAIQPLFVAAFATAQTRSPQRVTRSPVHEAV
jgi:hypothetical protein